MGEELRIVFDMLWGLKLLGEENRSTNLVCCEVQNFWGKKILVQIINKSSDRQLSRTGNQ